MAAHACWVVPISSPAAAPSLPPPPPPQVTFKNMRFMNGNSKMGFGGAVEVFGPVDVTFINCEFGGSISESLALPCLAAPSLALLDMCPRRDVPALLSREARGSRVPLPGCPAAERRLRPPCMRHLWQRAWKCILRHRRCLDDAVRSVTSRPGVQRVPPASLDTKALLWAVWDVPPGLLDAAEDKTGT